METRTKRNITIWAIVVLVLLNISSLATIWYHRYQFNQERQVEQFNRRPFDRSEAMSRRHHKMPPFYGSLEMTDTQRSTLDSIWAHYNEKRQVLEDSMNQTRRRMFRMMMAVNLDTGMYEEMSDQQAGLLKELNDTMLEMNRVIRANLTTEQQQALTARIERMQQRSGRESKRRIRK